MESATLQQEGAIASQATLVQPARTSAPTSAVVRASVPLEDACALQASLVLTARLRPAAVATEIVHSREHAFAAQAGWVHSVLLLCNVQIQLALAMVLAQLGPVRAQLASLA